jgi:menaquinone-dependent protoporphyrinogen oxidase
MTSSTRARNRHKIELSSMPVWLFSSGPFGDEATAKVDGPRQVAELTELTGAEGHQTFFGKVDRANLAIAERAVMKMVRAPYGDFRDWEAIKLWTDQIAAALTAAPA